ncbi:MAG: insulinase family protein [Candidatus Riflebacteria bacterium]|nr:insulinase family protein [Candidatus Riflebacteria bacterium]
MNKTRMQLLYRLFLILFFTVSLSVSFAADSTSGFEKIKDSIVETTLENGLKLIILPRREAPAVSMVTWVNVGGSDDPKEATGIAHMFEHMAFKGTDDIGTTDPEAEKAAMKKEDILFDAIRREKAKGRKADPRVIEDLEKKFQKAVDEAFSYVIPNRFSNILEEEGAEGLNAYTSRDQTAYIMSMPSNKLELWIAMESERFYRPRLRDMYREKVVVSEERRMTVENRPTGRLYEEFLSAAYKAHPYGQPIVGHMSDIENYNRHDSEAFYRKYYTPANMTVVIVGDAEPEKTIELVKKYWLRIPAGEAARRITTVEPPQTAERTVTLYDKSQPYCMIGWHIPEGTHEDIPALEAMTAILGQGRTSRLYKKLVLQEKIAVAAGAFAGFPGTKYPSLAVSAFYPAPGKTNVECRELLYAEIERMKTEPVTQEELDKVKTRASVSFLRGIENDLDFAEALASYQQLWGDWRELFNETARIEAVTQEDIMRVANKYFTRDNRTVASIETEVAEVSEEGESK